MTMGPWIVEETKDENGVVVQRRIFTAWEHGQLKGPAPVVTGMVTIAKIPGHASPYHGVHIDADDAELIRSAPELKEELRLALLQIRELQEIVVLCVDQGGLSFHVEGGKCPEDDTCDCPDAMRVNKAMEGYTDKPVDVKARLALIENGKCPECGEKAHLHNCTEKQKDVIDNGPSGITDTISFSAKPLSDLGLDVATYEAAKKEQAEGKRVPIEEVIKGLHGNAQCDQRQCSCHFPPGTDLTATGKRKCEHSWVLNDATDTHCDWCGEYR